MPKRGKRQKYRPLTEEEIHGPVPVPVESAEAPSSEPTAPVQPAAVEAEVSSSPKSPSLVDPTEGKDEASLISGLPSLPDSGEEEAETFPAVESLLIAAFGEEEAEAFPAVESPSVAEPGEPEVEQPCQIETSSARLSAGSPASQLPFMQSQTEEFSTVSSPSSREPDSELHLSSVATSVSSSLPHLASFLNSDPSRRAGIPLTWAERLMSSTLLPPSDFPQLSSNPNQAAQPSAASSLWATNPSLRTTGHAQQPGSIQRPQQQSQLPPQQQGQDQDAPFGGDDFRFGGPGVVGQLAGLGSQPPANDVEEFPPLGGLGAMGPGGDAPIDRRMSAIQNSAFGDTRNRPGAERNGGVLPPGLAVRGQPQPRGTNSFSAPGNQQQQSVPGLYPQPPQQQPQQPQQALPGLAQQIAAEPAGFPSSNAASNDVTSPSSIPQSSQSSAKDARPRLADMPAADRFSLPGLLAKISPDSADYSPLAVGQDLTQLGLDLGRPESEALYATFGTPFSSQNSTVRPIVGDFTLPAAYTVTNVPALSSKIASLSDDTLFAIFYGEAGTWNQEVAAQELYRRDWRWHIELKQWMQKDMTIAPPRRVNDKQEHGYYVFFNQSIWRREKKDFLLTYDHLDQSPGPANASQ